MITNREKHECKDCKDKLSICMALLKHVAEYHSQEPVEDIEIKELGGGNSQKDPEGEKDHAEEKPMFVSDKFISYKSEGVTGGKRLFMICQLLW